jgi:hypothetical protein
VRFRGSGWRSSVLIAFLGDLAFSFDAFVDELLEADSGNFARGDPKCAGIVDAAWDDSCATREVHEAGGREVDPGARLLERRGGSLEVCHREDKEGNVGLLEAITECLGDAELTAVCGCGGRRQPGERCVIVRDRLVFVNESHASGDDRPRDVIGGPRLPPALDGVANSDVCSPGVAVAGRQENSGALALRAGADDQYAR